MKPQTDSGAIKEFLTRGVENIFPAPKFLEARLKEGKPLTMYLGIDPTGPTLHLGHAIILRKLRAFQDLGHKVILLIGDFTGMIGDPTDKSAARKRLTREEVLKNAKHYQEQASRFIDFNSNSNFAELKYNSEWLSKLMFSEIVELASHFTVQQMLDRDMFQKRTRWDVKCEFCDEVTRSPIAFGSLENFNSTVLVKNRYQCSHCKKMASLDKEHIFPSPDTAPVYLHEFLYPLMQGYDSVAMDVDGEIGGNDQTFNMLAGRDLIKAMKGKEKFVIAMKLLVDPTGKKMGKSEGNMITLMDSADDMFGKVMSWTDGMILPGFELLTDVEEKEMKVMGTAMEKGENPKTFKIRLAKEVVTEFFDAEEAEAAEARFAQLFQKHETPEEIPTLSTVGASVVLADALVSAGFVSSKSDARRQVEQGGVKVDGAVVKDPQAVVAVGSVIQKGKRYFVKIVKG